MNQDGTDNVFSFHYNGNLTNLIPSISSVTPGPSDSKWQIQGAFGGDAGTVTYGGVPVTPLSWTNSEIDIPAQSTSGVVVVKTPAGLISNPFSSLGKPSLFPASTTIHQGSRQILKVTVQDGLKGATYSYDWTNTAKFGSIADASGHKGSSFTTSNNSVTYSPTPNLYGTDTITVQTFIIQADGAKVSLGKANATVEIATSGTLSIDPTSASIDQTQKQPIVVSVKGGVSGATYSYNWTNTAQFGTIADDSGHSGPSFTTPLAGVTYTPNGTKGSDTVSVEVFVVAADKSLHSLGKQSCQVSVSTKSLIFAPSDGTVAVSQTQVFTVSPVTGSFPSGASYVWTLSGQGAINGATALTTKVPKVTYKAPNHTAAGDLEVTVKDSTGKTLATGDLLITVEQVAISPKTFTFTGPTQATLFNVTGSYPSGTTYSWSCKSGGLSTTGTKRPYPNTLTTTVPSVYYNVANPPADGSTTTDTLTVTVKTPTGSSGGTAEATVTYGGTPFFVATYFNTQVNQVITSGVQSFEMDNLIGNQINSGQAYGIGDNQGFFSINILAPSGTFLAPGQSYTLFEISPDNNVGTFSLGGYIAANSASLITGTLKINSEIDSPAGNGKYIGFSTNIQCAGGRSIIANGVVLQHS
jgi:hypothetical protein